MRTLVVTPLYHRYAQSLASILALESDAPVDYLMLAYDDPYEGNDVMGAYANITRKVNHARDVMLAGDYDQMLIVEDDMVVPPDALTRLAATGADVAYGLTCWRHGIPHWSPCLSGIDDRGKPVSLASDPAAARAAWGAVIDVAGVGTFCTLIQRRVLEALAFRLNPDMPPQCCDWWLAVDCQRHGFTQRADLGVVCGHITPRPTPRIIWPDNGKRLWRPELLSVVPDRATPQERAVTWAPYLYHGERLMERKIAVVYAGAGQYLPGVPAADMTEDEWLALPAETRARALELDLYQVAAPESATPPSPNEEA